jgi:hypothetical protein
VADRGRKAAAARLGLPRTSLLYKMQKLGISRSSRRLDAPKAPAAEGYAFEAAVVSSGAGRSRSRTTDTKQPSVRELLPEQRREPAAVSVLRRPRGHEGCNTRAAVSGTMDTVSTCRLTCKLLDTLTARFEGKWRQSHSAGGMHLRVCPGGFVIGMRFRAARNAQRIHRGDAFRIQNFNNEGNTVETISGN